MQLRIVQVLWNRGQATAREITDALNESEPIAHSTVQTLLRQLEAKGAVSHMADGRTFVFFPKFKEEKVKRTAAFELLERVFGGSVGSLVAHLLQDERLSRADLDELERLIKERRKD
jgi:BlaI family penicillinase repressor